MTTTRRQFIRQTGSLALGAAGLGALDPRTVFGAADPGAPAKPTLVVLYLRGGSDPLSALIPYGDTTYYNIRPTIAVPTAGGRRDDKRPGVITLNDYFGFHPSMMGLARLFKKGLMAPIVNAGSTHPTRSHFDAQDFMERAAPGVKSVTEGWLNRYLYMTKADGDSALRAVSFQPVLPRSLRGQYPALAVPDAQAQKAVDAFAGLYGCDDAKETAKSQARPSAKTADAGSAAIPGADEPDTAPVSGTRRILEAGAQGIARLGRLNEVLKSDGHRTQGDYPKTTLGRQFRDIAKLIKARAGLEVTAIDYNGWDHHERQGATYGVYSEMMGNVSNTLEAFVQDLGPMIDRTVVLTMSEFGRTAKENGNSGSDHGHGGYMLAVGGPVNGGRFYGRWTGLSSNSLYEGRDLPVYTDFRDVFAEVLAGLFGFQADEHRFFPEYDANDKPIGLIKA
jgi:uncharacterized protein (DUF1501 family)